MLLWSNLRTYQLLLLYKFVAKKVNSIERILDNKKDADGTYQGKVTNGSAEISIDWLEANYF